MQISIERIGSKRIKSLRKFPFKCEMIGYGAFQLGIYLFSEKLLTLLVIGDLYLVNLQGEISWNGRLKGS